MPDQRKHRGAHPEDHRLFATERQADLRAATIDLCWLLTRGYATTSAMKLVGDRYALTARQRDAVSRCACSDTARHRRIEREVSPENLRQQEVWIDGYNVLTSVEAALAGGLILSARDGCFRDLASMHGSYRKVEETEPALALIGESLAAWEAGPCRWLLDQPVSNSGRLKTVIQKLAGEKGWDWSVELVPDPDPLLIESGCIVATADSHVLDGGGRWLPLARLVIEGRVPDAWVLDLSGQ